jgi:hypothetical protein
LVFVLKYSIAFLPNLIYLRLIRSLLIHFSSALQLSLDKNIFGCTAQIWGLEYFTTAQGVFGYAISLNDLSVDFVGQIVFAGAGDEFGQDDLSQLRLSNTLIPEGMIVVNLLRILQRLKSLLKLRSLHTLFEDSLSSVIFG